MYIKKQIVILGILLIILPKVEPQDPDGTDTNGTLTPASTPAGTPAATPAGTPAGTPAATPSGTPAGTPAGTSEAGPPSPPPAPPAGSAIVNYLNRRIRQVLNDNPAKDTADLSLAAAFNDERNKLANALVKENPSDDDYNKAEKAIENFRAFSERYMKIESTLDKALENLNSYEKDSNQSLASRYEALMMLIKLKTVTTLKDAEKALKAYEDFIKGLSNDPKPAAATGIQASSPPPNDEYKKYFDEILMILKKHIQNNTPSEMESLLQQLLKYPEQLKKLYDALSGISEEDSDDYDGDFLSGLFSIF